MKFEHPQIEVYRADSPRPSEKRPMIGIRVHEGRDRYRMKMLVIPLDDAKLLIRRLRGVILAIDPDALRHRPEGDDEVDRG